MLRFLVCLAVFFPTFSCFSQESPTQIKGAYWGSAFAPPEFGYNARVINKFQSEDCSMPDTIPIDEDWRSFNFRNMIAKLKPGILRFPGGTNANYWFWEDETREIVNENGIPEELVICEGTFIDIPESIDIGCVEPYISMNTATFEAIKARTSTTLESFVESIDYLKNQKGIDVQELFVLSIFDPFYYLGSPQFEFEFGELSNAEKRVKLGQIGVARAVKQLNVILNTYCDDCTVYEGDILFEIGNETFLSRYGKYLPQPGCYDLEAPCDECFVDVNLYADGCEFLIPYIKARFPNSKISLAAGRFKVGGQFWNHTLMDRFGPEAVIQAEALTVHSYPNVINAEAHSPAICSGDASSIDPDEVLGAHMFESYFTLMRRGMFELDNNGMELWLTEFNVNNRSDDCILESGVEIPEGEMLFYLTTWLQTLSVFAHMNSFFQYSSDAGAPWFWYDYNVDITKICLHSLYGYKSVSALREGGEFAASGIMTDILTPLLQESTGMRQVILHEPNESIALLPDGALAAENVDAIQPLILWTQPTEGNKLDEPYPGQAVMSWAFQSDTSLKVLMINMSNQHLDIDLSALPNMSGTVQSYSIQTIKEDVFTPILQGFESPHLLQNEDTQSSSSIAMAPYAVCVITSDFNEPVPPVETDLCPALASDIPSLNSSCGSTPCPECDCSFELWNNTNFENNMGIWITSSGLASSVVVESLPVPIQALAPYLGNQSLKMLSGKPFPSISSPVINTTSTSRIRVRFKYGSIGMVDAEDRIVLSYSNDGGQNFQNLSSWRYGVHFENGSINQAVIITDLAVSTQTQFRIRGRSSGIGKTFLIDNLEVSYCSSNPQTAGIVPAQQAGAQINPSLQLALFPNPAQDIVNLRFSTEEKESVHIEIFSASGVKQLEIYSVADQGLQLAPLDISKLASGIYFVKVSCRSATGVEKLIK
jgi:hypothetical protein